MFANKVKKVAAIHDLSGMGRVSLTVVIPILSSMGFQVCPLPTAILSNHTQYPDFTFLDLTDIFFALRNCLRMRKDFFYWLLSCCSQ